MSACLGYTIHHPTVVAVKEFRPGSDRRFRLSTVPADCKGLLTSAGMQDTYQVRWLYFCMFVEEVSSEGSSSS
jgi:hypothetical protein